jgi:hypothetical protein
MILLLFEFLASYQINWNYNSISHASSLLKIGVATCYFVSTLNPDYKINIINRKEKNPTPMINQFETSQPLSSLSVTFVW